jgi:hypothetical protein
MPRHNRYMHVLEADEFVLTGRLEFPKTSEWVTEKRSACHRRYRMTEFCRFLYEGLAVW